MSASRRTQKRVDAAIQFVIGEGDRRSGAAEHLDGRARSAHRILEPLVKHVQRCRIVSSGNRRLQPDDLGVDDASALACVPNASLPCHEQRERKHEGDRDEGAEGKRERILANQPTQQLPRGVAVRAYELSGLKSPQIRGHLDGARIATRRFPRHGLRDDRDEIAWQAMCGFEQRDWRSSEHTREHACGTHTGVRLVAGQQVVHHGSRGHTHPRAHRPLRLRLLRRHGGVPMTVRAA